MKVFKKLSLNALAVIVAFLTFTATCLAADKKPTASDSKPNVVLIMVDDLGAEALGCYGSTVYSTPNIDRLASQGARYENAYGTPSCTPSRAMIMTGLYPNRTGILERGGKGTFNRLPGHIKTFGQMYRENGYKTGIAGKWHLGDFDKYPEHPVPHGFDAYHLMAKFYEGVDYDFYYGPGMWQDKKVKTYGKEVYGPDLQCDFILDFIEANKDQPFLAYYPMTLVHKPFHYPPQIEDKIRHSFPEDASEAEKMYAMMVSYADLLVGRILDKLDALGLSDDTLVIFTADNGTPHDITSYIGNLKVEGGKLRLIESGYRVPFIVRWPERIPVGDRDQFMTLADVFPTLASLTGLPMDSEVDGMDLSHTVYLQPGVDRDYVYLAWEGGFYFVRDKRFRLHEDGRFYDIPVSSNASRYSETLSMNPEYSGARKRLEGKLAEFMKIRKTDDSYTIIPFKDTRKIRDAEIEKYKKKGNQ